MDKQQIIAIIKELAESGGVVDYDKIPEIDLYMDQLTTFTEDKLKPFKRRDDDKILTKTMINNYSKEKLLPPSAKKKYSKTHIALMLMIYHLKNTLALTDIAVFMALLDKKAAAGEYSYEETYRLFTETQITANERQEAEFAEIARLADESDDIAVQTIFHLIIDANFKKRAAEKIIDTLMERNDAKRKETK